MPDKSKDPVAYYREFARRLARANRLDPNIFTKQIQQESGFEHFDAQGNVKTSSAGARGIAQIVPKYHPDANWQDPEESLRYAAQLMRSHLDTYGEDYRKALAAYNGGGGAVQALEAGQLKSYAGGETQKYLDIILADTQLPGLTAPKIMARPQGIVEGEGTIQPSLPPGSSGTDRRSQFFRNIYPAAKSIEDSTGIPARVSMALAAKETNYGENIIGNNYFAIEGDYLGRSEVGSYSKLGEAKPYRKYSNVVESFQDFADLISGNESSLHIMDAKDDPLEFLRRMQEVGWDRDPDFIQSVGLALARVPKDDELNPPTPTIAPASRVADLLSKPPQDSPWKLLPEDISDLQRGANFQPEYYPGFRESYGKVLIDKNQRLAIAQESELGMMQTKKAYDDARWRAEGTNFVMSIGGLLEPTDRGNPITEKHIEAIGGPKYKAAKAEYDKAREAHQANIDAYMNSRLMESLILAAPMGVASGQVTTADDLLKHFTPAAVGNASLTTSQREELQGLVASLVPMPKTASVENTLAMLLKKPVSLPTTLSQMTADKISKMMSQPAIPEPTDGLTELQRRMLMSRLGYDPDLQESTKTAFNDLIKGWAEEVSQQELYRLKLDNPELENYSWSEMLQAGLSQPVLLTLEGFEWYTKEVTKPNFAYGAANLVQAAQLWAGGQRSKFSWTPTELEQLEDYWKSTGLDGNTARYKAWESWDKPGVMKFGIEMVTDPLNYIGMGILTKATKPLGKFGKLTEAAETGWNDMWNAPILAIQKGAGKVIPPSFSQLAIRKSQVIWQEIASAMMRTASESEIGMGIGIDRIANVPVKLMKQYVPMFMEHAMEVGRKYPGLHFADYRARAGVALFDAVHTLITPKQLQELGKELGHKGLEPTNTAVKNINQMFEMSQYSPDNPFHTPLTAAAEILDNLGITRDQKSMETVQEWWSGIFTRDIKAAERLVDQPNAFAAFNNLFSASTNTALDTYRSSTYRITAKDAKIQFMQSWQDQLGQFPVISAVNDFQRMMARQYLLFTAFGPFNWVETAFRGWAGSGSWYWGFGAQPADRLNLLTAGLPNVLREFQEASSRGEVSLLNESDAIVREKIKKAQSWRKGIPGIHTEGIFAGIPIPASIGGRTITPIPKDFRSFKNWNAMWEDIQTKQRAWYLTQQFTKKLYMDVPDTVKDIADAVGPLRQITGLSESQIKEIQQRLMDASLAGPEHVRTMQMTSKMLESKKWAADVERAVDGSQLQDSNVKARIKQLLMSPKALELGDGIKKDALGNIVPKGQPLGIVRAFQEVWDILQDNFVGKLAISGRLMDDFLQDVSTWTPASSTELFNYMTQIHAVLDSIPNHIEAARGAATKAAQSYHDLDRRTQTHEELWALLDEFADSYVPQIDLLREDMLKKIDGLQEPDNFKEAMRAYTSSIFEEQESIMKARRLEREIANGLLDKTKYKDRDQAFWNSFYKAREEGAWAAHKARMFGTPGKKGLVYARQDALADIKALMNPNLTPTNIATQLGAFQSTPLTTASVANLLGTSSADMIEQMITPGMSLMTKDHFIATVRANAERVAGGGPQADIAGWTHRKIGQVYDTIIERFGVGAKNTELLQPLKLQLDDLQSNIESLYATKALKDDTAKELNEWFGEIADKLEKLPWYSGVRGPQRPELRASTRAWRELDKSDYDAYITDIMTIYSREIPGTTPQKYLVSDFTQSASPELLDRVAGRTYTIAISNELAKVHELANSIAKQLAKELGEYDEYAPSYFTGFSMDSALLGMNYNGTNGVAHNLISINPWQHLDYARDKKVLTNQRKFIANEMVGTMIHEVAHNLYGHGAEEADFTRYLDTILKRIDQRQLDEAVESIAKNLTTDFADDAAEVRYLKDITFTPERIKGHANRQRANSNRNGQGGTSGGQPTSSSGLFGRMQDSWTESGEGAQGSTRYYHGTTGDWETINPDKLKSGLYGKGLYLTPSTENASEYAAWGNSFLRETRVGANIKAIDVPNDIKLLNYYDDPDATKIRDQFIADVKSGKFPGVQEYSTYDLRQYTNSGYIMDAISGLVGKEKFNEWLAFKGYDGIKSSKDIMVFLSSRNKLRNSFSGLSMRREYAPTFYSTLEEAIGQVKQEKFQASQLQGLLKGIPGVKADEIKWSGLDDWLREKGEGRVTKSEVLDYLEQNNIHVEEKVLGATLKVQKPMVWNFTEHNQRWTSADGNFYIEKDNQASIPGYALYNRFHNQLEYGFDTVDDAKALANEYDTIPDDSAGGISDTRYESYIQPFQPSEGYRELLLTLPVQEGHIKWKLDELDGLLTATVNGNYYEIVPDRGQFIIKKNGSWANTGRTYAEAKSLVREWEGLDQIKPNVYNSGHFDEPNILAHVRFDTRVDDQGRRVLFVQEFQSDWGQAGAKDGFTTPAKEARYQELKVQRDALSREYAILAGRRDPRANEVREQLAALEPEFDSVRGMVPDMPFKGDKWVDLSMKRMIRWAAENDYEVLAWTRGEHQAERYNALIRNVKQIEYDGEDVLALTTVTGERRTVNGVTWDNIGNHIGTENVDKLRSSEGQSLTNVTPRGTTVHSGYKYHLTGQNMTVRTSMEGKDTIYDKIAVQAANKLGRKFKSEVGSTKIAPDDEIAKTYQGWRAGHGQRGIDRLNEAVYPQKLDWHTVHALPITPEMKETVLYKGLPQFRRTQGINPAEQWRQAKTNALTWATDRYKLDFTDYSGANMLDAVMRGIFPFWSYESQRVPWVLKTLGSKPAISLGLARYMDTTDEGYTSVPGTDLQVNTLRGTSFMGGFRRLLQRDYPSYYDAFGPLGDAIEKSGRFGFYPGSVATVAQLAMGAGDPYSRTEFAELVPPWIKTPLNSLIALFPNSAPAKFIRDKIMPERFVDYNTMQQVINMGGDGQRIWDKRRQGIELTPEETQLWDSAAASVSMMSVPIEQIGILRFRPKERQEADQAIAQLYQEITGLNPAQQRKIKNWSAITGHTVQDIYPLSPTQRKLISGMEQVQKWSSLNTPLLPTIVQREQTRINEYWNEVETIWESARTEGFRDREGKLVQPSIQELDTQFQSGKLNGPDYRSKVAQTIQKAVQQSEALANSAYFKQVPLTFEEQVAWAERHKTVMPNDSPSALFIRKYYTIKPELKWDDETGTYEQDFDTYFRQIQILRESMPADIREELDERLEADWTPLQKLYYQVSTNFFAPYRNIRSFLLETYPPEAQAIINEYYRADRPKQDELRKETVENDPKKKIVADFQGKLTLARENMRLLDPTLDAWLSFWKNTKTLQPKSTQLLEQLNRQYRPGR